MRSEKLDGGHDHHPGEDATSKDDSGNTRADDVTHAKVFGDDIGADGRAWIPFGVVGGSSRPRGKQVPIFEECVQASKTQTGENAAGKRAALVASDNNISAGCTFGIKEVAVLLHDQLAA